MISFDIVFDGIPFEGTYDYETGEPSTFEHPGWPAFAYIVTIMVTGSSHNIKDLLSSDVITQIEDLLIERNS